MPRWTMKDKIEKIFRDNKFAQYKNISCPYNPNICTIEIDKNSLEEFIKILQNNNFSFIDISAIDNEDGTPYTKYEIWES